MKSCAFLILPTRALNFCKWAGTLYDEIPKWFARLRVSREAMPLDRGEVVLYCQRVMKFLKTLMVCLILPFVFLACDQKTDEEEVGGI